MGHVGQGYSERTYLLDGHGAIGERRLLGACVARVEGHRSGRVNHNHIIDALVLFALVYGNIVQVFTSRCTFGIVGLCALAGAALFLALSGAGIRV